MTFIDLASLGCGRYEGGENPYSLAVGIISSPLVTSLYLLCPEYGMHIPPAPVYAGSSLPHTLASLSTMSSSVVTRKKI